MHRISRHSPWAAGAKLKLIQPAHDPSTAPCMPCLLVRCGGRERSCSLHRRLAAAQAWATPDDPPSAPTAHPRHGLCSPPTNPHNTPLQQQPPHDCRLPLHAVRQAHPCAQVGGLPASQRRRARPLPSTQQAATALMPMPAKRWAAGRYTAPSAVPTVTQARQWRADDQGCRRRPPPCYRRR